MVTDWTVNDFIEAYKAYCEYHKDSTGCCDQDCDFCIEDINLDAIIQKLSIFYSIQWPTYENLVSSIFCAPTADKMLKYCFPCDIFDTDSKNWKEKISAEVIKNCKMMF